MSMSEPFAATRSSPNFTCTEASPSASSPCVTACIANALSSPCTPVMRSMAFSAASTGPAPAAESCMTLPPFSICTVAVGMVWLPADTCRRLIA